MVVYSLVSGVYILVLVLFCSSSDAVPSKSEALAENGVKIPLVLANKNGGTLETIEPIHKNEKDSTGFIEARFNEYSDWMRPLSNALTIGELSLPGTHDTMARFGGPGPETQTLPLLAQLEYGIRAFDIRCRHITNRCAMHHGSAFQYAYLEDVLDNSTSFLSQNPSEVLVMRLKEEYTPSDNSRPLVDTIEWYLSDPKYSPYIWRKVNDLIPTLAEVRGKIVILDQIAGGKFGIDWLKCGPCASPCVSPCIQDMYVIPSLLPAEINRKWGYVTDHLARVNGSGSQNFYLNFLSGTSTFARPHAVADRINPRFVEHMRTYTLNYRNIGAILMDYPLPEEITQIIQVNFQDISVQGNFFDGAFEAGSSKVFSVPPNYCTNFGDWNDRARSVDTMGTCVRIWEHADCKGAWRNVNSEEDSCAYNLDNCGWEGHVSSISHCNALK